MWYEVGKKNKLALLKNSNPYQVSLVGDTGYY